MDDEQQPPSQPRGGAPPRQKDIVVIPQQQQRPPTMPPPQQDREQKQAKDSKEEFKSSKEAASKKKAHGHGGDLHKDIKPRVADMTSAASSGQQGTSVITLAGENKGAAMKISTTAAATGHSKGAGEQSSGKKRLDGKGVTATINSNVQAINNSLLLHSSCSGGDLGVHLKLSTKSKNKHKAHDDNADK
ncbi:hypothetical protein ABZP36_002553 [Zizania latifolia]